MIALPQLAPCFIKSSLVPKHWDESTIYEIIHSTEYAYDQSIQSSEHWLRLTPTQDNHQTLLDFALHLRPETSLHAFHDAYGNEVLHFSLKQPYQRLMMETRCTVAVMEGRNLDRVQLQRPTAWSPLEYASLQHLMLADPLPEQQLRILTDYARQFLEEARGEIIPTIDAINQTIFRDFTYKPGSTVVGTSVFEVFEKRQGVCQDFTNLMLCLLRILNIPALYRTGYIYTGEENESHIAPDASHAWVEVFLPRIGWCGWDPTNGSRAGTDHVRLAAGRSSYEATPTSGTIYTPFQSEILTVHVKVKRRGALDHEL